ncbi:MAG: cytidine deaminase [Isosphaeraceae bacterium]|jgi:cytidine deaminase|nr:MAG: cytidine deaminase [Isosphaeraceae bacterium]
MSGGTVIDVESLDRVAREAAGRAYCPYSGFAVGAAVQAEDGRIFAGCNVENASYGLTLCAERAAVGAMVAGGGRRVVAVAIYTPTPEPTTPCGACRQVMREFGQEAVIWSSCDGPGRWQSSVSEMLPAAFGPATLAGR